VVKKEEVKSSQKKKKRKRKRKRRGCEIKEKRTHCKL
jgi:hypothetical protein